MRSAGVAPRTSGISFPNSERGSIGSATYVQHPPPPPTAAAAAVRPYEQRERYPTPELVYFTDVHGTTHKRKRESLTPPHRALPSTFTHQGFVDDWSYPTLAPVNLPTTLSRQTSPLGTVQPFSYAYPDAPVPAYYEPPVSVPVTTTSDERFARLLDEEKQELQATRRRQLVGPEAELPFRQSLRQLAEEVTRPFNGEEDRESRCGAKGCMLMGLRQIDSV